MNSFELINFSYFAGTGFRFNILTIETHKMDQIRSLFGFNISKDFFYIDLLFFYIKVFDNTDV